MAEKKDKQAEDKDSKPVFTTSSSLDKPLLDEKPTEKTADIDTSHLTIDDSTSSAGTLESEREESGPAIKTSHLSLKDDATDEKPVASPGDDSLIINNPYVKKTDAETTEEKTQPASGKNHDDEEVMLTSSLSDADFEKEAHSEGTKKDTDEGDDEDTFNAEDTGAIKQLLDTVKKPETVVRGAWSNSSARRYLLDNVDSYRAKDEDQNMEDVIEKMYGGTIKGDISPGKFLKENLLFSFLILLLIFLVGWKAANIFFPEVMPAINDQIIHTVQQTTISKPEVKDKKEKKPVATNVVNKEAIEEKLAHCLVSTDAQNQFITAFAAAGYEYTAPQLTLAYEEVSDSIDVWEGMNMNFMIEDAILRFRILSKLSLPYLQDAQKSVADYNQSLIDIKAQADELQERIRKIQTAGGNQSTGTINKRIPLRNQLDALRARLAEEPEEERFAVLLAKLSLVEQVLTGQQESNNIDIDEFADNGQEWLVTIADTESTSIGKEIEGVINPAIQNPADKLKQATPNLTAFHLSELEIALNNVLKLSSLITFIPENKLKPYKLELTGLSRRLNLLMKKELPAWIGFDRCLSQQRTETLARPE
jgi:hypothetical protein